jgi:hypothetical protein
MLSECRSTGYLPLVPQLDLRIIRPRTEVVIVARVAHCRYLHVMPAEHRNLTVLRHVPDVRGTADSSCEELCCVLVE